MTYKIIEKSFKVLFAMRSCKKLHKKTFRIERILRRKGDKSLIKWVGYSDDYNYWIDTKTIEKLTTDKSL